MELKHVMSMKSTYSIRIYELLKQYEVIGNREIAIDDLRLMCGIAA